MSLFIMKSVNCFDEIPVQIGICIITASTEFLESQHKTFLKSLRIFNYDQYTSFH